MFHQALKRLRQPFSFNFEALFMICKLRFSFLFQIIEVAKDIVHIVYLGFVLLPYFRNKRLMACQPPHVLLDLLSGERILLPLIYVIIRLRISRIIPIHL